MNQQNEIYYSLISFIIELSVHTERQKINTFRIATVVRSRFFKTRALHIRQTKHFIPHIFDIINMSSNHNIIRTYHKCEGGIEKSVPKITVWHHKACRVMTNADPEGRIFLSHPQTNNGIILFLLITDCLSYFVFKKAPRKSLNTL